MIERSDAIVLRSIDYGDTSHIVSLYTRSHGRVSVIAKGARRPGSRFGSTLLPMSCIEVLYYYRAGRDVHTLKESAHSVRLPRLAADVNRLHAGFRIIELVRSLTEVNDQNIPLYNLALQSLIQLDVATHHAGNVLPHFQLRLAEQLGFGPSVQRDEVLSVTAAEGFLELSTGAVVADGATGSVRASREALRAFAICARTDLQTCMRLRLSPSQLEETVRLADAYLQHHLDMQYAPRSKSVFEHILRSGG